MTIMDQNHQPRRKARRRRGHLCFSSKPLWLFLFAMIFITACHASPTPANTHFAQLTPRDGASAPDNSTVMEEVNSPSTNKFNTQKEDDMPGTVDFSVLAKNNLSSYDDAIGALIVDGEHLNRSLAGMFQARHALSNGYIGAEVAFMGPFFEIDKNQTHKSGNVTQGWPSYGTRLANAGISGFFDCQEQMQGTNFKDIAERGCESVISGIPHFYGMYLNVSGQLLDATVPWSQITHFKSSLYMRDGLRTWTYTWSPNNTNIKFDVEFTALASRVRPNVAATNMRVTPRGGNVTAGIIDKLDGRSAVRSTFRQKSQLSGSIIYVTNQADGRPNLNASTVSKMVFSKTPVSEPRAVEDLLDDNSTDSMSIGQEWNVDLVDGETVIFTKFVGIADSQHFKQSWDVATHAAEQASADGWVMILSEHKTAWNELMDERYITNYRDPVTKKLPEDSPIIKVFQASSTSDRFNIIQNLLPDDNTGLNNGGFSVGGIASEAYAGMVFWDMDSWIFPSLALSNPDYAMQMINYRIDKFEQAQRNAHEDYVKAKYNFSNDSALYPWTSGAFGNATGSGPVLDYEYHINTDIALMMFHHLSITGNDTKFRERMWPVILGVTKAMTGLLIENGTDHKFSIMNMTDPDEFHNHIDDGAFTLSSLEKVLRLVEHYQIGHHMPINETWRNMSTKLNIPKDFSGITMEFAGQENDVITKQSDVDLIPLLNLEEYSVYVGKMDNDYWTQRQTVDGPAMTNAIHAINENQYASSGTGMWSKDITARIPNLRAPWMQMSEQVQDDQNANGGYPPAFPFITGHGGNSMIGPLGYLGLKMYSDKLTIRPSLPHPLQNLGLPDFYYKGNRIRAQMNSTHTTLTRCPARGVEGTVDMYVNKTMPFKVEQRDWSGSKLITTEYDISMHETKVVKNDMYWKTISSPGNILQSQDSFPINTNDSQYTGTATDGSEGTYWMPVSTNASMMAVNTTKSIGHLAQDIRFDWGKRIPRSARVAFTNSSKEELLNLTSFDKIVGQKFEIPDELLRPNSWEENKALIKTLPGNSTIFILNEPVPVRNFAVLEVTGCRDCFVEGESNGTSLAGKNGSTVVEWVVTVPMDAT